MFNVSREDITHIIVVVVVAVVFVIFKKLQNVAVINNYQYLLVTKSIAQYTKWMLFKNQVLGLNQ